MFSSRLLDSDPEPFLESELSGSLASLLSESPLEVELTFRCPLSAESLRSSAKSLQLLTLLYLRKADGSSIWLEWRHDLKGCAVLCLAWSKD